MIYPRLHNTTTKHAFLGLQDIAGPGWFSFGKYGAQDLLVVVVMMVHARHVAGRAGAWTVVLASVR